LHLLLESLEGQLPQSDVQLHFSFFCSPDLSRPHGQACP
jgi:hypothetical protein